MVLQDDFLPRVSTQSVKRLFLTTFALYAFLDIARSFHTDMELFQYHFNAVLVLFRILIRHLNNVISVVTHQPIEAAVKQLIISSSHHS